MQSLAVKWRPRTFDEMCGQSAVIKILEQQLETSKISNCYLFAGGSGCGKAQPLTSKVYTPDGYKLMGEIKVGDSVICGDGKSTKVLGVFPQGARDIYKVYLDDNTVFEVADNHLNSIFYHDSKTKSRIRKEVLTTLELKNKLEENHLLSIFIDTPVIDCWEYKKPSIDPYLLGCLIGDGGISKSNLCFTSVDSEIIDNINKILERDYSMKLNQITQTDYSIRSKYEFKYHYQYKGVDFYSSTALQNQLMEDGYPFMDGRTLYKITNKTATATLKKYPELFDLIKLIEFNDEKIIWNNNGLKKQIKAFGLNVKSCEKFIPKEYLYNSKEVRLAILQGILDTDGTANKKHVSAFSGKNVGGGCSFSTVSSRLADDVAFLARSLGMKVSIRFRDPKYYIYRYKGIEEKRPCSPSYSLYIKSKDDSELFRLTRKKERVCENRFPPRRKITKVEFDRVDMCQCIYVESEDHTYLTDNLTLTHNTTIARALANIINKGQGQPTEIDAASHNGVDDVREIVAEANQRSLDSEYKIFIIDECHALSSAAWQAFLKCIEEPPKYTIFMFCTTNPEKIPATILNRVMRLNITKIPTNLIVSRLKYICQQEGFTNYNESCDFIAKLAQGGMRDAISMLEKCANYDPNLDINNVLACLGNYSYDSFFNLTNAIIDGDQQKVLTLIDEFFNTGNDLKIFVEQYLDFVLDLNRFALFKTMSVVKIPESMLNQVKYVTEIGADDQAAVAFYNKLTKKILDIKNAIKYDVNSFSTIEVMFIQICRGE